MYGCACVCPSAKQLYIDTVCGGTNNASTTPLPHLPQMPMPQTQGRECVILHGLREFAGIMKVTDAKIRRLFWIMFWPNLITQILQSRNFSLAEVREMRQKRKSEISNMRRI